MAYKQELADSDDPEALLAEITERLNRLRSPHRAAEYFEVEKIIDPRDTRDHLCRWADLVTRTVEPGPPSFGYRP